MDTEKLMMQKRIDSLSEMLETYQDAIVPSLREQIEGLERERDAALYDMNQLQGAICAYCANLYRRDGADHCECKEFGDLSKILGDDAYSPMICGKFKWRGLCKENGGTE